MDSGMAGPKGRLDGALEAALLGEENPLFERIAQNIFDTGYSLSLDDLSPDLTLILQNQWQEMTNQNFSHNFKKAGVGRNRDHTIDSSVRRDEICWINSDTAAGKAWLDWAAALQTFLNRRLFLGLTSFESHFARYQKDDFYQKHQDSFIGDANRVISIVAYLNPDWCLADAGELVLYKGADHLDALIIPPKFGTLIVFLSEEFPHEVLLSHCDRYSIAGWFRVKANLGQIPALIIPIL